MIVTRIGATPRCTNRARDASNCHSALPLTGGCFSPCVDRFATRAQTPEVRRVDEYDAWHRVCSLKFYGKPMTIRAITAADFASSALPPAAREWRVSLARLTSAAVKQELELRSPRQEGDRR